MKLDVLTLEDCETVRGWRNEDLSGLRTTRMLTEEQQRDFYRDLVFNRRSMRYWAIKIEDQEFTVTERKEWKDQKKAIWPIQDKLIGMGGLTDISLENRNAEISLIIDPALRGKGYGEQAVELILDQAFNYMNLHSVYGEVYYCNQPGCEFWNRMIEKYKAHWAELPLRKYWESDYWMSRYFCLTEDMYGEVHKVRDA